jgi:hypothetical protein
MRDLTLIRFKPPESADFQNAARTMFWTLVNFFT